jgi:hypothetical protein
VTPLAVGQVYLPRIKPQRGCRGPQGKRITAINALGGVSTVRVGAPLGTQWGYMTADTWAAWVVRWDARLRD